GSVMQARVVGDISGGSTWRATSSRFGSQDAICHDHSDRTTDGAATFDVSAPGTPGTYDATFTPNTAANCASASAGGSTTVTHALSVPTPFPNPNLAAGCGINVMLVLDKSGSIESSGATPKVKAAARAFLNALSDTGSQVAIIDFSTDAQMQVPYTA